MAKPVFSSTLKSLKFMQRAAQREEMMSKKEEVIPEANVASLGSVTKKCVVIMDNDPHPGAAKGRMSFQNFNPSIDKLNEEGSRPQQSPAQAVSGSPRENGHSSDQGQYSNVDESKRETNGDHKRKKSEAVPDSQYPRKSPKSDLDNNSSPASRRKEGFKKPEAKNLDWNLLRRSRN